MGFNDSRLQKVNRAIDGGPIPGKMFPKVKAIRTDVDADGKRHVRLYDEEYWLPIENEMNDESLIWESPKESTVILQYDSQDHTTVRMPVPNGKYGYPAEEVDPIGVYGEGDKTALSTQMTCLEYVESEDPEGTMRVHCIERKDSGERDAVLRLALEHHHPEIVEKELRDRLGDEAINTVDDFVDAVVGSVPDVVYHKCSLKTLVKSLQKRRYQKIDTARGSTDVVKHTNMSTSDIHMPITRLKTPSLNQQVTIKMRMPPAVCPIRAVYDLPAYERHANWYSDEYRFYNNAEDALIDTFFSIRMKEALRERYPGCHRIGEGDIERKGKLTAYNYEREIFLIPEDGETLYIRPEDVIEIIAEGECQMSTGYVKAVLEDNGLDAFVPKVVESEFCALAEVAVLDMGVDEEARSELVPWMWNDRMSRVNKTDERRPERLGQPLPPESTQR